MGLALLTSYSRPGSSTIWIGSFTFYFGTFIMFYIYDDDDENQSKLKLKLLPRSGHFLLGSSRRRINRSVSQIAAALLFPGAEFMGKPKQRHVAAKPASKKNDSDGEDGWVIVKKQRVTILVPPLPVGRMLDPGPSKPDAAVPVKAVNHKSTVLIEATTNTRRISLVDELEKLAPMAPNRGGDPITATATPPAHHFSALHSLRRLNVTMESRKPNLADTFRSIDAPGVSNISKTIKRSRLLLGPGSFLDGEMLLNQRLRASLLEKKLQKAGGLSRWLASIGLRQFVRIFQEKSFSKFQLVNLSMKKLKDMGADAVGPRRKLIHAIDCICQPHCFGAH